MAQIETRHLFTMPMKAERRPYGHTPLGERLLVVVTEATIEGPRLRASLLPGGTDWLTVTPDETILLDCRLLFETDDGAMIAMTYRGLRHGPPGTIARVNRGEALDPSLFYHRVAVFFETSSPKYAWLNKMLAIGARAANAQHGAAYEVFEVL